MRAAAQQIQKNHLYCVKSSPREAGGNPISKEIPCSPPRIGNWFAIDGRPIASARVVPAKYGPLNRAAAKPNSAPPIAAANTATTNVNQTGAS